MEFSVEKFISNFIEKQFPQFYQEEGPNFILFTKAYYEWLEQDNNPIAESRRLLDYRDIDNTLEAFLIHFQQKYLYGIPFNVIINKRLLLKHILDVYRSKGSINCYKLLFKMIYNEDVEIYLPSIDILRVSDGTWVEPKFIEVTTFDNILDYMGRNVIGVNSGTRATVENIVSETYNDNAITIVYFSNLNPKGGSFEIGERLIPESKIADFEYLATAPLILGSIDTLEILDGGRDYKLNDIIKIVQRNPDTLEIESNGRESYLKVLELTEATGQLSFDLVDGGYGFFQNSQVFIYRNDNTGFGASFELGPISNPVKVEYNTDIVNDYLEKSLEAITYNFPKFPSANLNSTILQSLSYSNTFFGTIGSLVNQEAGVAYTKPANVFVRSVTNSKPILADVTYTPGSSIVNLVNSEQIGDFQNVLLNAPAYNFPRNPQANVATPLETTISLSDFYNALVPNDVIFLQANTSDITTVEYHIIKQIIDFNSLELYGNPKHASTPSAEARIASVIFPSNFANSDPLMRSPNELTNGLNEKIRAYASIGQNIAAKVVALSGKGFSENERVRAGLYGTVDTNVDIVNTGINYTNNDVVVFSSPQFNRNANGYVITDSEGKVIDIYVTDVGSGFVEPPTAVVQSNTGSGAVLEAAISDFNYSTLMTGKVKKKGNGKELGYYSSTRGFLNSDKYIQDSYYYQDYSYEIRVSRSLETYKNILYETFHTAGAELFGKFSFVKIQDETAEILFENTSAIIT